MKRILYTALLSISFSLAFGQKKVYDARTADWAILTPAAADVPKINGPGIYGAGAGKEFIYRIPCEGLRPIVFSASGLPEELTLDTKKGIISGKTPIKEGEYNITFTASNSKGKDSRDFKLVIGKKLALTPPMGWNSWGGHMLYVSDELMRRVADVIVNKGLADVGFQYVSVDDCWMRIDQDYYNKNKEVFEKRAPGFDFSKVTGTPRDERGRILSNSLFPDMKSMTDYIHSYGLKAGIYCGPGPRTCQLYTSSFGYEASDAMQFADWGFDLLKYDNCSYREIYKKITDAISDTACSLNEAFIWYPMAQYLQEQKRDIQYNLCQYGAHEPWKWAPDFNIQSWRTGGDLNHNIHTYFSEALRIAKDLRDYSKPGQWNDPDFMYLGKIYDWRNRTAPPQKIPLTSNQQYQYVSLWSLICAPFFFSANIDVIDDFTIGLLRNADIVNVNQDELGHVAEVIREKDKQVILMKKLSDGSIVAGLFNTDPNKEQSIVLNWAEIGMQGEHPVRDLWRQKEIGKFKDGIDIRISANGVAVIRVK